MSTTLFMLGRLDFAGVKLERLAGSTLLTWSWDGYLATHIIEPCV
jgi:hypothetical protein